MLDFGDCQHPRDIASQHTSTHGRGAARAAGQARDPDGIDDGGRAHEPARGFPRQQFRLVVRGEPRGRSSDGHLAQSRRPGAAGGCRCSRRTRCSRCRRRGAAGRRSHRAAGRGRRARASPACATRWTAWRPASFSRESSVARGTGTRTTGRTLRRRRRARLPTIRTRRSTRGVSSWPRRARARSIRAPGTRDPRGCSTQPLTHPRDSPSTTFSSAPRRGPTRRTMTTRTVPPCSARCHGTKAPGDGSRPWRSAPAR